MNMERKEQLGELGFETKEQSSVLSANMKKLEVIQNAVSQLMDRIDEIIYKGWDKDLGMAYLSIGEIERTVRLIDMAFYPLFKEMSNEVRSLENTTDQLFSMIKEKDEKTYTTT